MTLPEGREESLPLCAAVAGSLDTGLAAVQKGSMCAICQPDALIMELLATKDAAGIPSSKVMDRTLEDGAEDMPEDV